MTSLFRPTMAGVVAAGAIGFLAMSAPAQAVPFSGTLTYGGGTNQSYAPGGPATLVANATSVNEGTDQQILTLTGVPGAPGAVGQLLIYAQTILNIPVPMSGAIGGMQINWGANARYSFVSTGGTYLRDTTNSALNFKWYGTFTDALGYYDTQVAQYTQGWSQASNGQLPNTGGTLNSDPNLRVPVPEPASIAMLGIGLLGLGMVVSRRRNRREVTLIG